MSHWFHKLSYPCNACTSIPMPTVFHPTVYYCYYYRFILLLLLLFHYYHHYKTVATDKPLRANLFLCAAELTTHLLRLINILERCYTYDVSCTICVRWERCTVRCFRACADEAQHSRMSVRFLVVHMSYALCRTHSVFEYSLAPLVSNQ
jgi:hypothetical protein